MQASLLLLQPRPFLLPAGAAISASYPLSLRPANRVTNKPTSCNSSHLISSQSCLSSPTLLRRSSAQIGRSSLLPLPPVHCLINKPEKTNLSLSSPSIFPYSSSISNKKRSIVLNAAGASFPSSDEESERAKLAQVTKRLEKTSRYFKRLGTLGLWGQLVCTVVSAVILSFSVVVQGKVTSPFTFYATAAGIAAAFVSVFWSFGYIRLSNRLRRTANDPSKAPPRADVVKSLKNGIVLNLLGMGSAILGMQATVGLLVAKALTTSAVPYYQGISPSQSPVLALDVFLVQASANTILSHFLGLVSSLELLRSVTLPHLEAIPVPKAA